MPVCGALQAHRELYTKADKNRDWRSFRIGFRLGLALVFACWACWDAAFDDSVGVNLFKVGEDGHRGRNVTKGGRRRKKQSKRRRRVRVRVSSRNEDNRTDHPTDHLVVICLCQSPIVNVYAACGSVLMLGWCWAVDLLVWERLGVDYAAIFDFATPITPVYSVLEEISTTTAVYLASASTGRTSGKADEGSEQDCTKRLVMPQTIQRV
jgi:hypothetical protein